MNLEAAAKATRREERTMRKIPTVFERSEDRRHVVDVVTPGCEWVLAGEGEATRKYDGTCVMLDDDGSWWARREVKPGKDAPAGWVEVDHDETTGKRTGWEPVEQSSHAKAFTEAIDESRFLPYKVEPGTFELLGPKVNGNPEGIDYHVLVRHGYLAAVEWDPYAAVPRDFDGLEAWLTDPDRKHEGIVWHHPDGRMAKLKRRDFPRPA